MAFPSVTNVDGTNPGPNSATPDTPQSPIGNIWKLASFTFIPVPSTIAANTSAEQTFTVTGLVTSPADFVWVNKPSTQGGLGIVGSRVSAAGVLAITYGNFLASTQTPTTTETYTVFVARVQPNWVNPGSNIDW